MRIIVRKVITVTAVRIFYLPVPCLHDQDRDIFPEEAVSGIKDPAARHRCSTGGGIQNAFIKSYRRNIKW